MNAPLRRVALFCLVLFGLLMANANFIQVVKRDDYYDKPGNLRRTLAEYDRQRGQIIVGGQAIAHSVETDDQLKYLRTYENGPLYAPVTGFYSVKYESGGLERATNDILAGTDDRFFIRRVLDLITGELPRGGSVVLTLNPEAQQAAYQGLEGKKGAVAALDPRTGEILAMATNPSYDPNLLSTHDDAQTTKAWEELNDDPNKPMLNRAAREAYPPGSTFKLVTAAAALSSGDYQPDTRVDAPGSIDLPQSTADLPNYDGDPCGPGGQTTVIHALEISCNTAFANIGMDLGAGAVQEQAEKFGFNNPTFKVPMSVSTSRFPRELSEAQLAQSSIGQYEVAATPLQMAMVVAGIANDGLVMEPYLVQEIRGPDTSTVDVHDPKQFNQAVEPDVAERLTDMMVNVVEDGTGGNARMSGIEVAGKTGTAQHDKEKKPHAWFVSFAPADDPQVAVAVVLEEGAPEVSEVSGNRLAAPIAKSVMEAVLGQ